MVGWLFAFCAWFLYPHTAPSPLLLIAPRAQLRLFPRRRIALGTVWVTVMVTSLVHAVAVAVKALYGLLVGCCLIFVVVIGFFGSFLFVL